MKNAKELFNIFKNEAKVDDFKELYKALLAREIGLDEYTDEADKLMDEMLEDKYYRDDNIGAFINEDLINVIHEAFSEADFEVDSWF